LWCNPKQWKNTNKCYDATIICIYLQRFWLEIIVISEIISLFEGDILANILFFYAYI